MKKKIYITTPIFYVNDVPHIGHSYTSIICDALARFYRLNDFDVLFTTGTDEHGLKVEKAAEKSGMTPNSFVDKVSKNFRESSIVMSSTSYIFFPLILTSRIFSLNLFPLQLSHSKKISAINCISIFLIPSPKHSSHLPPSTLKEKSAGARFSPLSADSFEYSFLIASYAFV